MATKEAKETGSDSSDKKNPTATFYQVFSNADTYDIILMILGTLGGVITGVSLPAFNVLFGRLLDNINDSSGFGDTINQLCVIMVIIAIINLAAGFLQVYCWTAVGERQTQKFRERYVRAILSQEIGWFDTCGASELSTKVAESVGKVQDGLGRKVGDLTQYMAQVIGSFVVSFYLCWRLTVVLLAAIPAIGLAGAFMINAVTAAQNQSFEQYAAAGGLATETLNAVRTVTALNMQPSVITRYRKCLFEAMRVGIKKGFNMGLGHGGLFCVCFFTYALGFWYGGRLVADDLEHCTHNCLTGGDVMAVFFSTIMGSMAMGQMAPPITAFFAAKAAVASIFEVLDRKPLIDGLSNEGERPDVKIAGEIELNDLHFAYPSRPNIQVCKGYNLVIKPGETVALVGPSGCGKSTIINLLLRFYDPSSGTISLDGYDIKNLNIKWLRSHIGYVGQEPILFSGTIGDNIAYGLNPELKNSLSSRRDDENQDAAIAALKEQVIAAAKLANAHDFISEFPNGYDTDVGSNGVAMSGGQKQRIAIARALIKKPAVLLLDEATSALDATSERVVQQSIDTLARNKAQTTIIIAHRLSTIRNADKICVINQGQIVEVGTHDELIAKNGQYADLVRLQMSAMEDISEEDNNEEDVARLTEEEEHKDDHHTRGRTVSEERKRSRAGSLEEELEKGIVAVPTEELQTEAISKEKSAKLTQQVRALILQYPGLLLTGCIGAAIFGAVFPGWGMLLANTQDSFYQTDPVAIREDTTLYAYYYILLGGTCLFSAIGQFYGTVALGEKVSSQLRSEMFEAIMRRNIGFFDHEENNVGQLTTQLSDDSRIVHKAFGEALAKQLQALFTLALGLALGFSASWKIAFVVLACFPLNIAASAIQMQAISGQQYDTDSGEDKSKAGAPKKNPKAVDPADKSVKDAAATKTASTTNSTMSGGSGAVISTAFTHMRTVSAFSMHHKVADHYASLTRRSSEVRIQRSIIAGLGFGGSNTSLFLTYALLFWYGSELIQKDEITFVQLMEAILTLMLGALGLGNALADMGDQKDAIQSADRIFRNINEGNNSPIDGLSTNGVTPTNRAVGRIVLKDVNFKYPTRQNAVVCKGYNIVIEPGETVALVGPSGSGKSTIINLLLRFYDPDSGEITLDGVNIKDLNVRWLRSQIGYVGQEPVLFVGSVADNIARGRSENVYESLLSLQAAMEEAETEYAADHPYHYLPCIDYKSQPKNQPTAVPQQETNGDVELGPTGTGSHGKVDDDIVEACRASNAHDFITTFPQGYDTDIGEGSIMVSGGQKQRIAIARALIKKPAVLLLDEATSALDAASERVVQQSIDALAQSKAQTTIIIAHRLSTIRNADKIIVIDHGSVAEIGKHEELLAKPNGLYKQLWDKQSGGGNK